MDQGGFLQEAVVQNKTLVFGQHSVPFSLTTVSSWSSYYMSMSIKILLHWVDNKLVMLVHNTVTPLHTVSSLITLFEVLYLHDIVDAVLSVLHTLCELNAFIYYIFLS